LSNRIPFMLIYALFSLSTVIFVRPMQSENAPGPIEVTDDGIVTLVRLEQPLNA